MHGVCKQTRKSGLKKQVYRKEGIQSPSVAHPLGCRNIRKVKKGRNVHFSFN